MGTGEGGGGWDEEDGDGRRMTGRGGWDVMIWDDTREV